MFDDKECLQVAVLNVQQMQYVQIVHLIHFVADDALPNVDNLRVEYVGAVGIVRDA